VRALITGITGFVGSHLAEFLVRETDWDIIGMVRWRSPLDNIATLVPMVNRGERLSLVYADLRDSHSLAVAVKDSTPDYVFHLAAQSYPHTSFVSAVDTLETNIQGTVRLLDALRETKAVIHVCSSSEVYGRAKSIPINEEAPFHPASPYAISKAGADMIARHYAEAYGMNIQVTRMFTHTGVRRGDVFVESSFAKQIAMIEAGQMAEPIRVGNLQSLRTVVDVRDAVRAYYMVLTVNPIPGAVYNIGGDFSCTVGDILAALQHAAGTNYAFEVESARLRPVDADLQVPDCSKFMAHTGWRPEIPFEDTMKDLVEYWRKAVRARSWLIR